MRSLLLASAMCAMALTLTGCSFTVSGPCNSGRCNTFTKQSRLRACKTDDCCQTCTTECESDCSTGCCDGACGLRMKRPGLMSRMGNQGCDGVCGPTCPDDCPRTSVLARRRATNCGCSSAQSCGCTTGGDCGCETTSPVATTDCGCDGGTDCGGARPRRTMGGLLGSWKAKQQCNSCESGSDCGCETAAPAGAPVASTGDCGCEDGSCGSGCGNGTIGKGLFGLGLQNRMAAHAANGGMLGHQGAGNGIRGHHGAGGGILGHHGSGGGILGHHGNGGGILGHHGNGGGIFGHHHGNGGGLLGHHHRGKHSRSTAGELPHTAQPPMVAPGPVPQYVYPYYTTRGPRDFLMKNPPSIGY